MDAQGAFFAASPLLVLALVGILLIRMWRLRSEWESVGPLMGMVAVPDPPGVPTLFGERDGFHVQVRRYVEFRPGRNDATVWSAAEVAVPGGNPSFRMRVSRRRFAESLRKGVFGEKVLLGDAEFERLYNASANDAALALRALGGEARTHLIELEAVGDLRVEAGVKRPNGTYASVDSILAARPRAIFMTRRQSERWQGQADGPRLMLVRWVRRGEGNPEFYLKILPLLQHVARSLEDAYNTPRPAPVD